MELLEREIDSAGLQIGMYVSRLDCPWAETPFPLQGVMVSSRDDILALQRHARRVWIDIGKSTGPVALQLQGITPAIRQGRLGLAGATRPAPTVSFEEEVRSSRLMLDEVSSRASGMMDRLRQGTRVSEEEVEEVVQPVVRSLKRNPDAYFWLESLRSRHHYTYTHAVNCCALAAVFGRYLGLDEGEIESLSKGALMLDIGMGAIPPEIINHSGPLDDIGRVFVARHVREGVDRLQQSGIDDPAIIDMLLNHHEHFDGSGYPEGKKGHAIPLFGRIASIIDSYDAMTSDRPYRTASGRGDALQQLVKQREGRHDPELVEQFVRCLGVYPVGSLVELNTGEVGMVMSVNPAQRLRPRLMMLTNATKQVRAHFIPVDLGDAEKQPSLAGVHISRGLAPGSYGLDPGKLGI